ncbi:MAG TPA: PhzF family phenazine biosynthesis protein [Acidobacteriota bacterium]|nr:PhzF family phenazine biosynthesis protein [Acidobacteriota bacterium]
MQAWIAETFADQRFAGNDAAVVAAESFPATRRMQSIALGLGLPTTAFLVGDGGNYRIRWFTPRKELNLCGHATIASACYLYEVAGVRRSSKLCFRTCSGPLYARLRDGFISLDLPRLEVAACPPPQGLREALGVEMVQCARSIDDIVIELHNEEAVASLRPDFAALAQIECRGHVVTARAGAQDADFVSRSFFPALGVDEDQVCVSAHCKLGPYWGERLHKSRLAALQLSPRGGRLLVELAGQRVKVAGQARIRERVSVSVGAALCGGRHG